jgi:hypothetical protein
MIVDYHVYQWGPYLWRSSIGLDICNEILTRFRKSTLDHKDGLASLIDNVKKIEDRETRGWFVNIMQPYLYTYMETRKTYLNIPNDKTPLLEMHKLWINIQKKAEFNPEHTHGGDLSFVIYLKIPPEIKEENKKYVGRSGGPGAIQFRYGEKNDWALSGHEFLPTVGELLIFPATLAHMVYPFYSDVERISVSGNFGFIKNE